MFPKLGLTKYAPFLVRFRTPKYQHLGILNSIPAYQSHQNYTFLPTTKTILSIIALIITLPLFCFVLLA